MKRVLDEDMPLAHVDLWLYLPKEEYTGLTRDEMEQKVEDVVIDTYMKEVAHVEVDVAMIDHTIRRRGMLTSIPDR